MKIPEIFDKCQRVVDSKRQDYVTNPEIDNHENFKRSAEIASWFKHDRDKAYAVLIGTKIARLGSLLSKDTRPNNESIEDNFGDIINYFALWMERITESDNPKWKNEIITCISCGGIGGYHIPSGYTSCFTCQGTGKSIVRVIDES